MRLHLPQLHHAFAAAVTEKLRSHPNVTVVEGEVREIPPEGHVIIATGPLTSEELSEKIAQLFPDSPVFGSLSPTGFKGP